MVAWKRTSEWNKITLCIGNNCLIRETVDATEKRLLFYRYLLQCSLVLFVYTLVYLSAYMYATYVCMGSLCRCIVVWCTLREWHTSKNCDNGGTTTNTTLLVVQGGMKLCFTCVGQAQYEPTTMVSHGYTKGTCNCGHEKTLRHCCHVNDLAVMVM